MNGHLEFHAQVSTSIGVLFCLIVVVVIVVCACGGVVLCDPFMHTYSSQLLP